jgi:hypothetical protein
LVEPAGHAYPAVQLPEHDGVHRPDTAPNVPPGHRPLQADVARPDTAPKSPALQFVHVPAPAKLYVPAAHIAAVGELLPATHTYPALHCPLQLAVDSPSDAPYTPAGHTVHSPDPDTLYVPRPQMLAVPFVDPAGHAYPALQLPLHATLVSPAEAPNLPAGHGPEQADTVSPGVAPYSPAAQSTHTAAPPVLNFPAGHMTAVELVLPKGHAYPGLQGPLHKLAIRPDKEPWRPPAHSPLQVGVVSPDVLPKVPAGQLVQDAAAPTLY